MKITHSALVFLATLSPLALASDFLESYEHSHASQKGTPFSHSFGIEPAFTGRDIIVSHTYLEGEAESEHEMEVELEWAFTKRLGVIVELPYLWEDEEGEASFSGLGDIVIVPRVLLVETENFLLTLQAESKLPSGSSSTGGEKAIAPGINLWNDLGYGFTLNSAIAIEHEYEENANALEFGLGLIKTFSTSESGHSDHTGHHHGTAGLLNLHLEVTGESPLNGEEEGDVNLEGIFGVSYALTQSMDVRLGYIFPITTPKEIDYGLTGGLIYHF